MGNNFLQVCKQLYALTDLGPEDWADLNELREAMGVMQHHDAITGTEKEHVAKDYARRLTRGMDECEFVAATAMSKIATGSNVKLFNPKSGQLEPSPAIPFQSCLLSNISQCAATETKDNFVITVYNPLSRNVSQYIRVPVVDKIFEVLCPSGNVIPSQYMAIPEAVKNIPGRMSLAQYELVFLAKLPPLGFKSYYLNRTTVHSGQNPQKTNTGSSIQINTDTGLLSSVLINNITLPLKQEFLYYLGAVGNNEEYKNRSSGAYIFRPSDNKAKPLNSKVEVKVVEGELVIEAEQKFNDWASQIIRLYKEENFVEFQWLIGPIPDKYVIKMFFLLICK